MNAHHVWAGWSQPPHPIDVIPSFDPHADLRTQARLVIWDYYHDDDLRSWADRDEVKKAFGVKKKEDLDTAAVVAAYENPKSPVWSKAKWQDLSDAVQKAIAKRTKLGPLPGVSTYDTDPVVIYYYDNDRFKKIVYPKSSISAQSGYALDPGNIYWWKNHDIGTFESMDGKNWGNEGFSWDKDVAGNVGQIVGTVMAIVGTVLQVIPGVGTGIGAALIVAAPIVGSLLNAADTAFQGGDMGSALANIGQSIIQVANKELGSTAGFKMDDKTAKELGQNLGMLAADAAHLNTPGAKFTDVWNAIVQNPMKYGVMGDDQAKTIMAALGSDPAAKVFKSGYDTAQYASPETINAVTNLFADNGARSIFQFGAGIGLLKKAQAASGSATMQGSSTKGRKVMTQGYYVGSDDSMDDFGKQMGATLLNAFGQVASTAAQQGAKALIDASQKLTPQQALSSQIAILGPKYGVFPGQATASVATKGEFAVGQSVLERQRSTGYPMQPPAMQQAPSYSAQAPGHAASPGYGYHPVHTRDFGAHNPHGFSARGAFAVGQCVDPHNGEIVPMYSWDQFGNVICLDPHDGKKIDASGNVVSGAVSVGQCVMPDGSILPIAGWDDSGNIYCYMSDGRKVDATGHVVGVQSTEWYDDRFGAIGSFAQG